MARWRDFSVCDMNFGVGVFFEVWRHQNYDKEA